MEIKFLGGKLLTSYEEDTWESLLDLLKEQGSLVAIVKKTSPQSILLKGENRTWALPLTKLELTWATQLLQGDQIRLELASSEGVQISKIVDNLESPEFVDSAEVRSSLTEALLDLAIPVNETTKFVARALVEGGFPLSKQLMWSLLPWAEEGSLENAILLLQAGFPLTKELVECVHYLKARTPEQALVLDARANLSPNLMEALARPRWENRGKLSDQPGDLRVVQSLLKLVVEEGLIEGLLNRSNHQENYLFALPFLLEDQLQASWVRINPEQKRQTATAPTQSFRIDLLLPTISLGLVEAELFVSGKNLSLNIWLEQGDLLLLDESLFLLKQELVEEGWNPSSFAVLPGPRQGGLADAQSSCFTL